jgi:hypothetical protein
MYYTFRMANQAEVWSSYNVNGDILVSHNVKIDNVQRYDSDLNSQSLTDWDEVKDILAGSVSGMSPRDWQTNPVFCIDFAGIQHLTECPTTDYMVAGKTLDKSVKFSFPYTLDAAARALGVELVTCAVVQKRVTSSVNGGAQQITVTPGSSAYIA